MTQIVTRLDEGLVAQVDGLVRDGVVATRSEAVRVALERLVDEHRRASTGEQIARGYRLHPQTEEELAGLDAATDALVAEEPW